MGRYKLPEEIKAVRGTKRKDREYNELSPTTLVMSPADVKAPSHLNPEAKKIYKEVVSQLVAMKMLQPIDTTALCIYANAIVTIAKMQKELDKDGYVTYIKDEDGNITGVTVNPIHKVLKDAINVANTIGSQFGWSPVSRLRLVAIAAGKEDKNDFTDFTE